VVPNWEATLRERLAVLLTPKDFREGDLLTAERLNVLIRLVRELEADVKTLKAVGRPRDSKSSPGDPGPL